MKKSMLLLAIGYQLMAISFCSCSGERKLKKLEASHPELFKLHNSDSIKTVVKETEHDSTIYLPGKTNTYTVSIPCPQVVNYTHTTHFKGGSSTLNINAGKATVTCHYDSLQEIICNIRDSVKTLEIKNTSGIATTTIVAPLTGWEEFAKYFTDIILIVATCYFGGKYGLPIILKAIKGGV
jgi:hypothetical protein